MNEQSHQEGEHNDIGPPPFFQSWRSLYILVLGTLIVLIILFALITNYYQ